jgi:perosamine synthetase
MRGIDPMNTGHRIVPFGKPIIGEEEKKAVLAVLDGPILVHGPKAVEFEKAWSAYTKSPHSITMANCTAALHLVYFHLGLKAGDEVIVPAQTHTATAHAVELMNAKPVFVDAEPKTGNINIDLIEDAITPRTKAISIVHFLGMPVDMVRINAIAKKHNLKVIEDCALAIGTYLDGVHAGLLGDFGCFSFYPVKHMTTAEGGMITTKDAAAAALLTRQKAFCVDRHMGERKIPGVYEVTGLGFNYRMNEIEAALGIVQLTRMPAFLKARKENYAALERALRQIPEVELLQSTNGRFESSHYSLQAVLTKNMAEKRFEIVALLNEAGIGTSVYYPKPVPHMQYYREKYGYKESSFPEAARISYQSISLSVGPHLNLEDMSYVAEHLKAAIAKVK